MNTSDNENAVGVLAADLNGQDLRVGIVQARFNEEHCVALTTACIEELIKLGVSARYVWVDQIVDRITEYRHAAFRFPIQN